MDPMELRLLRELQSLGIHGPNAALLSRYRSLAGINEPRQDPSQPMMPPMPEQADGPSDAGPVGDPSSGGLSPAGYDSFDFSDPSNISTVSQANNLSSAIGPASSLTGLAMSLAGVPGTAFSMAMNGLMSLAHAQAVQGILGYAPEAAFSLSPTARAPLSSLLGRVQGLIASLRTSDPDPDVDADPDVSTVDIGQVTGLPDGVGFTDADVDASVGQVTGLPDGIGFGDADGPTGDAGNAGDSSW